jgi:hypothetical protein
LNFETSAYVSYGVDHGTSMWHVSAITWKAAKEQNNFNEYGKYMRISDVPTDTLPTDTLPMFANLNLNWQLCSVLKWFHVKMTA